MESIGRDLSRDAMVLYLKERIKCCFPWMRIGAAFEIIFSSLRDLENPEDFLRFCDDKDLRRMICWDINIDILEIFLSRCNIKTKEDFEKMWEWSYIVFVLSYTTPWALERLLKQKKVDSIDWFINLLKNDKWATSLLFTDSEKDIESVSGAVSSNVSLCLA